MKIKKLIKDIPNVQVKGSKEVEVSGVSLHSKLVAPGNLFIARKGMSHNGVNYIPDAIAAGAVAVATDIYDPSLRDVVQLIHPDIAGIEGLLAANYYHRPSQELLTVGVTGTNGKTTTALLTKHLLDGLGLQCGLIGTVEYIIGDHRLQASRTTPDVCNNQKMLREMANHDCKAVVMEVSSHALDQTRVDCIDFDIGIFTNLTLDHLDYHGSIENYASAKQKLFHSLDPSKRKPAYAGVQAAIVNVDSCWHELMKKGCQAEVIGYGIDHPADLTASNLQLSSQGTAFELCYKGHKALCHSPFIGRFNVYNYMAAAGVGLALGVPLAKITGLLDQAPLIPGRLERVPNAQGLNIYVDFAHTDDALLNVLLTLQEVKQGRLLIIFGCGGDRDKSKRPKMAAVCESVADLSIVTSDNPRTEDPETICRDILEGFTSKDRYLVEVDRRKAIAKGIQLCSPDDILVIAGKGHETYQIFANNTIEFDDHKVARDICKELEECFSEL